MAPSHTEEVKLQRTILSNKMAIHFGNTLSVPWDKESSVLSVFSEIVSSSLQCGNFSSKRAEGAGVPPTMANMK